MSRGSRWALLIWLAAVVLAAIGVARTPISTDLSAFLPRSPSAQQAFLADELHEGPVSRLILLAIADATPEAAAELSRGLAERLRRDPRFVAVRNGEGADLARDRDFLWRNRYLLSPAVGPQTFTAEGLRQALERDLQLLQSSAGILVKRDLPADPTLEMLRLLEALQGESRPATQDGVWFSPDLARALLVLETQAPGFDLDAQQQALEAIAGAFVAARSTVKGAEAARLFTTGPAVFAVAARASIKWDASRFSILAGFLIAALLLLTYRSFRTLGLALVPVASGALAGVAAVGLGFGAVHGVTLGFGVTLMGEAVDYTIYLFTQTAPGSEPRRTLAGIWPTLRLGMLTSIFGYSAMLLSSFTGLAQLGLLSIVGLVAALAVTRVVLPALAPAAPAQSGAQALEHVAAALIGLARRVRYVLLALVALGAAILVDRHDRIWDKELASLSPVSAEDVLLDEMLRRDLGAPDVRYLLLLAGRSEAEALAASEAISPWLERLVADGTIAGFDAASRFIPDEATQRTRQAAIPPPEVVQANLEAAMKDLPFRSDLFAPFLADLAAARVQPPLTRASLAGTSLALRVDSLLQPHGDGWTAVVSLRGVADPARLAEETAQLGRAGLTLLDLKGEADALYRGYRREAVALSLGGSLAILGLLGVSLRSPRRVWRVAAPLAAAVVVTAAAVVAAGERLSIFHLVGLMLVVGVGSNYALFFERQSGQREGTARVFASVLLANLCTAIGFGVLGLSRVPVLHGIGITVALGALLSLVFAAAAQRERHDVRL